MKHEQATEEIREMAALYALGSLTQHEARSFEIHIREGCSVCEAELRRFERTAAGIGFSVDEIDAPGYVRDLLMARIEREIQTAAEMKALEETKAEEPPAAAQSAAVQQERKKPNIFLWAFVAFFAVLAILAAYAWKTVQKENVRLQAAASTAQENVKNLQKLLDAQKGNPPDLDLILASAGLPGARIVRMEGQSATPDASGAIFWDTQQNQCLFFGLLPPAQPGKIYQLWINTPTEKIAAGLIKPSPTGRTFATIAVPKPAPNATALFITLEPEGGSATPTMPFIAFGALD